MFRQRMNGILVFLWPAWQQCWLWQSWWIPLWAPFPFHYGWSPRAEVAAPYCSCNQSIIHQLQHQKQACSLFKLMYLPINKNPAWIYHHYCGKCKTSWHRECKCQCFWLTATSESIPSSSLAHACVIFFPAGFSNVCSSKSALAWTKWMACKPLQSRESGWWQQGSGTASQPANSNLSCAIIHTWPRLLACCDALPPERRSSPDRGQPARWPSQRSSKDAVSLSEEKRRKKEKKNQSHCRRNTAKWWVCF